MASYDYNQKTGKARFFFRYDKGQYNKTLKMESARHAERLQALIEETIQDLERGKLVLSEESDVAAFILSGGKVVSKPRPVSDPFQNERKPSTVKGVFDTYVETLTPGSKETNTIETEKIHGGHFKRVLGEDTNFDSLTIEVLQNYVDERASNRIVRDTIRKELATLRVVWTWAQKRNHVASLPSWRMRDLTFPKAHEKPPFQTWEQIARKIERGRLTPVQIAAQWECLWLNQRQTLECLTWVQEHGRQPFIYPLFASAAFTGARRGELLRSERDDWDLEAGFVAIRQKKADKSKTFTRRNVPIHPFLSNVMQEWFEVHPGGSWAFANDDGSSINPRMATKYFKGALAGGKWAVLHGWHTFRHSLASNMASASTDQRIINEILGHHTEEMERRYRHLLPQKQEHALHALFCT
jgi:integrase